LRNDIIGREEVCCTEFEGSDEAEEMGSEKGATEAMVETIEESIEGEEGGPVVVVFVVSVVVGGVDEKGVSGEIEGVPEGELKNIENLEGELTTKGLLKLRLVVSIVSEDIGVVVGSEINFLGEKLEGLVLGVNEVVS